MTRTEERLVDALGAVGRGVREETLPPLPARGPAPRPGRWGRWGRWLAPLAAAAGVVLVVVVVSSVHLFSGPGRPDHAIAPPRYYAAVQPGGIVIRATATGAVTGRIPNVPPGHGSFGRYAMSVAAADGGNGFFAAFSGTAASHVDKTWVYSFRLTSAGRVTGLAVVRGGVFSGLLAGNSMAVSPDGSKVAVALHPPLIPSQGAKPAEIGVLDLATGTRTVWAGGLRNRGGLPATIPNVSWASDGRSLVFVSLWCNTGAFGSQYCAAGADYGQVRTLHLTPGGGRLSQGSVLLADSRRYPDIIQARSGPGGKSLTVVVLSARTVGLVNSKPLELRVTQIPLAGGRLGGGRPRLLYRGAVDGNVQVSLGSDAPGRYLILAWARNGWIDHGRLRPLPPQGGVAFAEAW
jgi:hypothetical protein